MSKFSQSLGPSFVSILRETISSMWGAGGEICHSMQYFHECHIFLMPGKSEVMLGCS